MLYTRVLGYMYVRLHDNDGYRPQCAPVDVVLYVVLGPKIKEYNYYSYLSRSYGLRLRLYRPPESRNVVRKEGKKIVLLLSDVF